MSVYDRLCIIQYQNVGDGIANNYLRRNVSNKDLVTNIKKFFDNTDGFSRRMFPLGVQYLSFLQKEVPERLVYLALGKRTKRPKRVDGDFENIDEFNKMCEPVRDLGDDTVIGLVRMFVVDLQRILLNAPKIDEPVTVYRGLTERFTCGKALKGFMSTSINPAQARAFAQMSDRDSEVMEILVPAGTPLLKLLFDYTAFYFDEEEVLLPAGSSLLCNRRYETPALSTARMKHRKYVLDVSRLLKPGKAEYTPSPVLRTKRRSKL